MNDGSADIDERQCLPSYNLQLGQLSAPCGILGVWVTATPLPRSRRRSSATTTPGTRTTSTRSSRSTLPGWCSRTTRRESASRAQTYGQHIARIFENWPDLAFRGRRLYARDGLVVSEWTATATDGDGRRLEWDGVDIFPFEDGLILRKDVYSSSHRPASGGRELRRKRSHSGREADAFRDLRDRDPR